MNEDTREKRASDDWPRIAIVVVVLMALGSVNLIYPFTGDQALFSTGARQLRSGAMLYRDFWDLKQPGIYWFYAMVGRLFGYNEIGIHLGELIYFCLFAVCIVLVMRRYLRPWLAELSAILTVGVYFIVCTPWHLTQVEGLVAFPLFLCLSLGVATGRFRLLCMYLAGVAAGVVMLLKLVLILIPIAFMSTAVIYAIMRRTENRFSIIAANLLLILAGVCSVVLPALAYFWVNDQFPLVYKTFFVYPPRVLAEVPGPGTAYLKQGARWFLLATAPLLPLAAFGAVARLRRVIEPPILGLVVWLFAACFAVLIQRMWWSYHFLLLIPPIALLAAVGIDEIGRIAWRKSGNVSWWRNRLTLGVTCLVIAPYSARWTLKVIQDFRCGPPTNAERQICARECMDSRYAAAKKQAERGSATALPPGPIFVMGDPQIYHFLSRFQAVPINGWALEWLLPEQWEELSQQLSQKLPSSIFVDSGYEELLARRGKPVLNAIKKMYHPSSADAGGTWYFLRETVLASENLQ